MARVTPVVDSRHEVRILRGEAYTYNAIGRVREAKLCLERANKIESSILSPEQQAEQRLRERARDTLRRARMRTAYKLCATAARTGKVTPKSVAAEAKIRAAGLGEQLDIALRSFR